MSLTADRKAAVGPKIFVPIIKLNLPSDILDYASASFQYHFIHRHRREKELIWVIAGVSEQWDEGGVCVCVCECVCV